MSKTSLDFGFFCDVNQNNIAFFAGVNHLSGPLTSTALRGHGLWLFTDGFRSVLFSEFTCFHVLALKFFLPSCNCSYRASKSRRNTDVGGVKTNQYIPCFGPPTDSTIYRKCFSHFSSTWLANWQWFFNRPIMAHTQILVHRWGPRTRISALFRCFVNCRVWRRIRNPCIVKVATMAM